MSTLIPCFSNSLNGSQCLIIPLLGSKSEGVQPIPQGREVVIIRRSVFLVIVFQFFETNPVYSLTQLQGDNWKLCND